MNFEQPNFSSGSSDKETPKPRFVATEIGLAVPEAAEKLELLAKDMNEKKIDSILNPIVYPDLKEKRDSILDDLSFWEKHKRAGDEDRINLLEDDFENASKKINEFDAIRSKIALSKELNSDEISQLISFIKSGVISLDYELQSINKENNIDRYKSNREKATQLSAAQIFLLRKYKK